ncbi:hypothetical protein ABKN59_009789 [Abortiporus biennis]
MFICLQLTYNLLSRILWGWTATDNSTEDFVRHSIGSCPRLFTSSRPVAIIHYRIQAVFKYNQARLPIFTTRMQRGYQSIKRKFNIRTSPDHEGFLAT